MDLEDVSTQLLYTTMPIWVENHDGSQASGTGFVYSVAVDGKENESIPLLITNYHVVQNAERGLIEIARGEGKKPLQGERVRAEIEGDFLRSHVDRPNDLVALPIGGLVNQLHNAGNETFFKSVSPNLIPDAEIVDKLAAIEEITFIGYPSGLYDQHNVSPIARRGITATPVWNDFQGDPAFLVDAGVFPGSSGSPVFLFNQGAYSTSKGLTIGNRLIFLGVMTETMIRQNENTPQIFLGLGKVVKSRTLQDFAKKVSAKLLQRENS